MNTGISELADKGKKIAEAKMIFEILDEFGNRIPQDVQKEMRDKAKVITESIK